MIATNWVKFHPKSAIRTIRIGSEGIYGKTNSLGSDLGGLSILNYSNYMVDIYPLFDIGETR